MYIKTEINGTLAEKNLLEVGIKIGQALTQCGENIAQQCTIYKNEDGTYATTCDYMESKNFMLGFLCREKQLENGNVIIGTATSDKKITSVDANDVVNHWRFNCGCEVLETKWVNEETCFDLYEFGTMICTIGKAYTDTEKQKMRIALNRGKCPMCERSAYSTTMPEHTLTTYFQTHPLLVDNKKNISEDIPKSNRLKTIRTNVGMTQQQLADKVGKNVQAISKFENGSRDLNKMALETAVLFADALGCTVKQLYDADK